MNREDREERRRRLREKRRRELEDRKAGRSEKHQGHNKRDRSNGEYVYRPPSLDDIRRKMQEVEKNLEGSKIRRYKPVAGENVFRVLPGKENGVWFAETRNHFRVGPKNRRVVCLKPFEKDCFICELVDELFQSGNEFDQKKAKAMRASTGVLLNIIDVQGPEKGVLLWEARDRMFHRIMGFWIDPEYGDFLHPQKGYNFKFIYTPDNGADTYGPPIPRNLRTPIPYPNWYKELYDLERFNKPVDYTMQKKIYEGNDQ